MNGTPPAPKPAPEGLGAKMASARAEREVTREQLASKLGVRPAMVSMIESGEAEYSDELGGRIKTWVDSGSGVPDAKRASKDEIVHVKRRTTIKR